MIPYQEKVGASQVALAVKNPPANAGDLRDVGSIPWSGRYPAGGNSDPIHCSCLENPGTEEPGELQSRGSQTAGRD